MKLSLIIPIYNVEKYIVECLESICQQLPLQDVEVILINDGTPDQSIVFARHFLQQQDIKIQNQFTIIEQNNQGLSAARNTGLEHTSGDYIAFLDSDDLIKAGYFEEIFSHIHKEKPDIIQFYAERLDDQGNILPFLKPFEKEGYFNLDQDLLLNIFNRSAWYSWLRVYKKTLFEKMRFPVGKNYEDAYIIPYLFLFSKNIFITNKILLQYRINATGITATKSKKNIDDLGDTARHYLQDIEKYPIFTPTLVAISQCYINDSLKGESFTTAYQRWNKLRQEISNYRIQDGFVRNPGNRLFYKYGVWFLFFDLNLRKLGLKK